MALFLDTAARFASWAAFRVFRSLAGLVTVDEWDRFYKRATPLPKVGNRRHVFRLAVGSG